MGRSPNCSQAASTPMIGDGERVQAADAHRQARDDEQPQEPGEGVAGADVVEQRARRTARSIGWVVQGTSSAITISATEPMSICQPVSARISQVFLKGIFFATSTDSAQKNPAPSASRLLTRSGAFSQGERISNRPTMARAITGQWARCERSLQQCRCQHRHPERHAVDQHRTLAGVAAHQRQIDEAHETHGLQQTQQQGGTRIARPELARPH